MDGDRPCCVSDASVKGDKKAVAVWFGTYEGTGVIITQEVEGLPHDSGRGELAGPLIVLQVLKWVSEIRKDGREISLWLDNLEVVNGFSIEGRSQLPSKVCKRNADMWAQIDALKEETEDRLKVLHVKGHQDEATSYEELKFEEQKNVDCDTAAKERVSRSKGNDYIKGMPPSTRAMFWTSDGGLTCDPYWWRMERDAEKVVRRRLRMGGNAFRLVDWDMHGKSLRMVSSNYRPGVQKMIWGENPCSVKLCRDGKITDDKCPLCGEVDTKDHFLKCNIVQTSEKRGQIIGNVRTKMRNRGTNPFLAQWVEEGMSGKDPILEKVSPLRLNQCVRNAFGNQATIGWENMRNGRIAKGSERMQVLWEDVAGRNERAQRKDPRETVAQTVTFGLLGQYELWKLRNKLVEDFALHSQQRTLVAEISLLKEKKYETGVTDRSLFLEHNIPSANDGLDRMEQWVRSVKNSIERRKDTEKKTHRRIDQYFRTVIRERDTDAQVMTSAGIAP